MVDAQLPEDWDTLTSTALNNGRLPERSEPFLAILRKDLRSFGVSVIGWLQGSLLGANEYLLGQRAKVLLLERALNDLFEQWDVVPQTSPTPSTPLDCRNLPCPSISTQQGFPSPPGARNRRAVAVTGRSHGDRRPSRSEPVPSARGRQASGLRRHRTARRPSSLNIQPKRLANVACVRVRWHKGSPMRRMSCPAGTQLRS